MIKILGVVPGFAFFIYIALKLEEIQASYILGILAMSIAVGSITYFFLNAPAGRHKTETAFGITGRYKNLVYGTVIPVKSALGIFLAISCCCILGLILNYYGF